jgi:hypothetical protein
VANEWEVPPHLWGAPPPPNFTVNQETRTDDAALS